MTFTNPVVVNVTTQTVTLPPVLYTDYWLWSAVQGESYPPTLVTTTYSQNQGRSAYSWTAGASKITFPYLPRIGPAQTATGTLTMTARFFASGNTSVTFTPFDAVDNSIFVLINWASGLLQVGYRSPGGGAATLNLSTGLVSTGTWLELKWVYNEAAGTFDFQSNGVSLIGGPIAHQSTATTAPHFVVTSSANIQCWTTAVRVAWS